MGYSLPCYDRRAKAEFLAACSDKEITVINTSETALESYRTHFGKDVVGQLGTCEECQP